MKLAEFLDLLAKETGTAPTKCGDAFSCRCPAHKDTTPSLSVSEGADGRILVKCHAGCATEAIISALQLTMADLFPAARGRAAQRIQDRRNLCLPRRVRKGVV